MRSLMMTLLVMWAWGATGVWAATTPNIVYIMCDDLGYGDIQCLNREHGKIATPHADKLASQGMIFTDAHSGSSVCTPTRYGLLTGRYAWRSRLQKGVVTGYAPCLIAEDRLTVASLLKQRGYHTAIVGKWHLDFQYLDPKSGKPYSAKGHKSPPIGAKIPDGPIHRGFDYYHGFHHARNMEAVIENDRVIAHDAVVNMLPRLTEKAVAYIDARAGKKQPFFLYVPLGSPHTPIVPSPEWEGRSKIGKYGDFVMQTDHVVGEISKALQRHGMTDNTLVVFTSDNGCSKAAGIGNLAKQGHKVSAHLRGSKADIWDGGHRVPFIVRWPGGGVKPGSTSAQTICHVDLMATVAEITGASYPSNVGEDSVSFLPALTGKPIVSDRAAIVHHSISGRFSIRQGPWKLILAPGSGGWSAPNDSAARKQGWPEIQLYHMGKDIGEQNNLQATEREQVARLTTLLKEYVELGRSTPGPQQSNDVAVDIWKSPGGRSKRKGNK